MKLHFNWALTVSGLCLAGSGLFMHPAAAQQQSPSDAPPQTVPPDDKNNDETLTHLDQGSARQTIQTINNNGQTEVRVTNGVGTYVVKPNNNIGTSLPGDGQSNSNNPVQWVIKSWGGSKNTDKADDTPPVLQPNPNGPDSK